jgi:hypothetical protein
MRAAGFLAAFAIAGAWASAAAAEPFDFTFEKKSDAKKWDPIVGQWEVADGAYSVKFGKKDVVAFTALKAQISDVHAEIVFTTGEKTREAGALVRGTFNKRDQSYGGYFVAYGHDGTEGFVEVLRLDGILKTKILCQKPVSVADPSDWQTAELDIVKDQFKVWFNGNLVCEFSDTKYKKGLFGLHALGTKGGTFSVDRIFGDAKVVK